MAFPYFIVYNLSTMAHPLGTYSIFDASTILAHDHEALISDHLITGAMTETPDFIKQAIQTHFFDVDGIEELGVEELCDALILNALIWMAHYGADPKGMLSAYDFGEHSIPFAQMIEGMEALNEPHKDTLFGDMEASQELPFSLGGRISLN